MMATDFPLGLSDGGSFSELVIYFPDRQFITFPHLMWRNSHQICKRRKAQSITKERCHFLLFDD